MPTRTTRARTRGNLAETEPAFDAAVQGRNVNLSWLNLEAVTINFIPMDVELLFSRMLDLLRASMQANGRTPPRDRSEMIRAALSGGDLSTSFGNTANKIAETVWLESPPTWKSFAAIRSATDFRAHSSLRPSFGRNLTPLPEGGGFDHGTLGEEVISWSVATFGKMYSIGRQAFVNDDAGVFSELVPGLVRAAARTLANLVYATIARDRSAHFTSGRGKHADRRRFRAASQFTRDRREATTPHDRPGRQSLEPAAGGAGGPGDARSDGLRTAQQRGSGPRRDR